MEKNEHKARAHLARAQQLLKPSDRDLLNAPMAIQAARD